jgi:hypothetical protein
LRSPYSYSGEFPVGTDVLAWHTFRDAGASRSSAFPRGSVGTRGKSGVDSSEESPHIMLQLLALETQANEAIQWIRACEVFSS